MVKGDLMKAGQFEKIQQMAEETVKLVKTIRG